VSQFLASLVHAPAYHALRAVTGLNDQGNLIERTQVETAAAQVEIIRWACWRACYPAWVVETGTNRALFGYLLSRILDTCILDTCDIDPAAGHAVAVLNAMQRTVHARFHHGPSIETLPGILARGTPGLAWVDGDHSDAGCYGDLAAMAEAHVPFVLVDDADSEPGVKTALARFLEWAPYVRETPPYPLAVGDARGIAVLVRGL
jgi:hypothetical protein